MHCLCASGVVGVIEFGWHRMHASFGSCGLCGSWQVPHGNCIGAFPPNDTARTPILLWHARHDPLDGLR
jgi:hypothetical protein